MNVLGVLINDYSLFSLFLFSLFLFRCFSLAVFQRALDQGE